METLRKSVRVLARLPTRTRRGLHQMPGVIRYAMLSEFPESLFAFYQLSLGLVPKCCELTLVLRSVIKGESMILAHRGSVETREVRTNAHPINGRTLASHAKLSFGGWPPNVLSNIVTIYAPTTQYEFITFRLCSLRLRILTTRTLLALFCGNRNVPPASTRAMVQVRCP